MPAALILMNPSSPGRPRRAMAPRANPGAPKVSSAKKALDSAKAALFRSGLSPTEIGQALSTMSKAPKRRASEQTARKNPTKESKMARRMKKMYVRRNPTKKGNPTQREKAQALLATGDLTQAQYDKLYPPKAVRARKAATAGMSPEQLAAFRKQRGAALAASRAARFTGKTAAEISAMKALEQATRAKTREANKLALERAFLLQQAASKGGPAVPAEIARLLARETKRAAKREASRLAAAPGRSQRAKARAKSKFDTRIVDYRSKGWKAHIAAASMIRARKSASQVALARAYMSAKSAVNKHGGAPGSKGIMRVLGLSALPNASFVADLKTIIPMAALGAGGIVAVAWGVSKVVPMVKDKLPESVRPFVAPVLALTVGVGGSMLMKKNPSLAKFSGALLGGGIAVATFAALNAVKDASGASMASKVGLAGLGDYHMGMSVGDYHMGMAFGDYHMGAIDVVTDRRMLAPPGGSMPRHDTRRDGVDQSIESFSGTLAGDIFDQG